MAWTAPMTATTNQTLTAAQWNTNVRDNMNETEAGKATTRGRLFTSTGANAVTESTVFMSQNNTAKSTSSTSYTTLSTTVSVGSNLPGTVAVVFWSAAMGNTTATATAYASVAVSGNSTVAASDAWAVYVDGMNAAATSTDNLVRMSGFHRFTGLTAGWNVFTIQHRVSSGTGWFSQRSITAWTI